MMWFIFAGKELFRKKIILITCVLTLCFVALYSWGLWKISRMTEGVGDSPVQQLLDRGNGFVAGAAFAQMIAAFLVFFSTMGAVSGEVESGLMLAQLARPIPRWKVYMGKYAGIACWMLLYNAVLFWAILLGACPDELSTLTSRCYEVVSALPIYTAAAARSVLAGIYTSSYARQWCSLCYAVWPRPFQRFRGQFI